MNRVRLLAALTEYEPWDEQEAAMTAAMKCFVEANEACFSRSLACGHITGSAWIVDRTRAAVLLVYHGKLHRWLQPGGHCDEGETALQAAVREAHEETGISRLHSLTGGIFDIDVHPIPARRTETGHLHYDVRFAFEASRDSELIVSPESREVRWVDLVEVQHLNPEASVMRMVQKTPGLDSFGALRSPDPTP